MEKFRFLQWHVYRESKKLLSLIIKIVKKLPKEYRFELGSQIIRSTFSIVLNIAEGSGKTSDRELNRFLEIALGSVYETFAGLDVLKENSMVTEVEFSETSNLLESIASQLGGFKKKLDKSRK